jgi:tetratricopeptide (TPR) repeat protein
MGKPQQALDALKKAISRNAGDKEAYLKLAQLYLVMKDYTNCADMVQKVLEIDPRNADAFYLKGVVLDENGEADKAVASFKQAVQCDPTHFDALMHLGYANISGKPQMAADYFNSALKVNPASLEAMYNLGMLFQEDGKPERALEIYTSMLKSNPVNKLALYNSGYVNLVYLGKYAEGAEFFTKALAVDSVYAEAYYNRGYCYELSGQKEKARSDYEKVLQLKINDPKAIQAMNRLEKKKK